MKSYIAKKEDIKREWKLVDAEDQILGRMAVKIAMILMGKDKPIYTAHVDTGDYVVVVNAEKVKLFGTKADSKEYQSYSHYPGGQKITSYEDMKAKHPERIVELAVKRMLPKNKIGRHMFKKLKVVCGPEHEFAAQKPVKIEL
jgi:large subunit ribosomal protein L13